MTQGPERGGVVSPSLSFRPGDAPLIMGIVNVTPDSFSGDGLLAAPHAAHDALAAQVDSMLADGAHILDIGGESSRPGSTPVSTEDELRRVMPVIAAIKTRHAQAILSVDTVKAAVAEAALKAGAMIVNDISALRGDPAMAAVVARYNGFVVLMDNRSDPRRIAQNSVSGARYEPAPDGDAIVADVRDALAERAEAAVKAGIRRDRIILDPGIGFGKSVAQNLALIRHVGRFKELGYPVLIAASRKSFIGEVLNTPVAERLEGTAAAAAVAAFLGADILRVHDVKFMARVARFAAALAAAD